MSGARRIRRYHVNPEVFLRAYRTGTFLEVTDGFPDGAVFKGFVICPTRNEIAIFAEHESFNLVPEGCDPPTYSIALHEYRGDEIQVFKRFIENAKGYGYG